MERREFLAGLAAPLILRGAGLPGPGPATDSVALPTAAQLAWMDLEIGMFVHLAPNTWQEREYDDGSIPPDQLAFAADPDQWADTAVGLGARYIVLVAKHQGGFCLWQTDSSAYSVRGTPWKGGSGDVMAELSAACARRGLGLGVYLSPRDDFQGAGQSGRTASPDKQDAYNAIVRQQLTELLTRYGPIVEVWFDGSSVVPVGDILTAHAGSAMVFQGPQATIRWVGNEDGFAPDPVWNALDRADGATGIATALHGDPTGSAWMPLEVDVSIRRPNWFWNTTNASRLVTLPQLLEIYYRSVGRGAQLLLNLPPDRTGRIPEADAARARELGDTIRARFAKPAAATPGKGASVMLTMAQARPLDHIVLEEDLRGGQRILSYRLEGRVGGAWRSLGGGTSVGHKRIHPIAPKHYDAIRATFPLALGTPALRRLAAFGTGAAAPATWFQSAPVWADDDAGRWSGADLDVDLTPKIAAAAQYRLRLVAVGGGPVAVAGAELLFNGVPSPDLVRAAPGRSDVLILTIPALGQTIRLRGHVTAASRGAVLLRRL
ncbi:MAG TPA: alpha-L-fucosidase [Gemmatimonadales bacterium]|nr:alpha-L-fucosidase [Gemmatimonadales bacterium]